MNKKYIIFIVIAFAALGLIFFTGWLGSPIITENVEEYGEFIIPLSDISENANWYEYDSNGVTLRFFTVRASDGTIKTGFDACDVCYASQKGYSQDGDFMVCNNCGNRYPIVGLGTENKNPGGCWPGYLPNNKEGVNLVVKESDLESGRSRFI